MRSVLIRSAAIASTAVVATTAGASPLNLTSTNPDVASGFIAVDYNASTLQFSAQGQTQNLALPPNVPMGLRLFSLSATIDNAGNIAGPGSLTVRGDYGGVDQLLFSSNLITAFGFGTFNKFEFLFSQQSGSLAPAGTSIGTILVDTGLSFPGGVPDFSRSFSGRLFPGGPGAGNADTFVPAPSAAGFALGGLLVARRRRR